MRHELDDNERIERDERIIELLTEAATRIDPRPGFDELSVRLLNMAFEIHAGLDPHCTCNDCMAEFAGDDGDGIKRDPDTWDARPAPAYFEPHCAVRDEAGVCTVCNLAENTLHGVIDTEGDKAPQPHPEHGSTGGRSCGQCLMERVEIVTLDAAGVCPRCGTDYGASEGGPFLIVKSTRTETTEAADGRLRERTVTTWDIVRDGVLLGEYPRRRDARAAFATGKFGR